MKIEIYTRGGCSACMMAKAYLSSSERPFTEVIVGRDIDADQLREQFPGVKTVPVIVIDGVWIGGHQQLLEFFAESE